MKKYMLLLGMLLILTGCSSKTDIVGQLDQRYTEADLYSMHDHLAAWRYGENVNDFIFEAAGLHERTGHFIVVYSNGMQRFWIETVPLKQLEDDIPLDTPLFQNGRIEYFVSGCEQYPYVGIYLQSDTMTTDEIATSTVTLSLSLWTEYEWLVQPPIFAGAPGRRPDIQRFFQSDSIPRWIDSSGDTLIYKFNAHTDQPMEYTDTAYLRRYHDGQWHDTGLEYKTTGSRGELWLDLRAGYYQLVFPTVDARQVCYPFAVGSLADMTADDLPPGRKTDIPHDVALEISDIDQNTDEYEITVRSTFGENPSCFPAAGEEGYFEIELDGRWCALPARLQGRYADADFAQPRNRVYEKDFDISHNSSSKSYYFFPTIPGTYRFVGAAILGGPNANYVAAEFTIIE